MSESVIFQCDFCGSRSEEEPAGWPRQKRCRVELCVAGRRLIPLLRPADPLLYAPIHAPAPDFPFPGPVGATFPPAAFPMMPGMPPVFDPAHAASEEEEDERWSAAVCDGCMRRIAGLFGLWLETPEEGAARRAPPRAPPDVRSPISEAVLSSLKGEVVAQYPTRPPRSEGGGLVEQFPTPKPHQGDPKAPVSEPDADDAAPEPDAPGGDAKK